MTATTGSVHDLRSTPTPGRAPRGAASDRSDNRASRTTRDQDARGNTARGGTAVAERRGQARLETRPARTQLTERAANPQRTAPGQAAPHRPHSLPRTRRLGSRQQVSVRGRRIIEHRGNSRVTRLVVAGVILLILGISSVMYFSGLSTQQSFEITEAKNRSNTLANELATLEKDVANAQSSGHVAAEATRLGMVKPGQPGVLVDDNGAVTEVRPADSSKDAPVVDVNGNVTKRGATSDPQRTNHVEGLAPSEAVAAGNVAPNAVAANPAAPGQQAPAAPAPAAPGAPAPGAPGAPAPGANTGGLPYSDRLAPVAPPAP